ncbi:MAG TPA: hypothetical protein VFU91_01315 [Sphingomicrobium sp.]|jgi:hypothetical protein|nr:hypothetical protein [Sphingomicrobium sp.]
MPGDDLPPRADVDEINLSIADGLKSCRSIVANYRAMIRGETNDNIPEERAANDEKDAATASDASEA